MKRKTLYIIAGTAITVGLASWAYYEQYIDIDQGREHGVGTKALSCPENEIHSLRLQVNGKTQWEKTHDALLTMPEAVATRDKRFPDKKVLPLTVIIKDLHPFKMIEIIPCDDESVWLSPNDIDTDEYYLGQNNKNRMKLLTYDNKHKRYKTIHRNVIHINITH